MLRLNNSSVVRESINGGVTVRMFAVFDDVTNTGSIKRKHAQRFTIKNDLLTLNGAKHHLPDPVDLNAEPEELIQYFEERFGSVQPDIFLQPPTSRNGIQLPKSIKEVRWEYPDMAWRAIDKAGTVAYFERRPVLDKAGYWVSVMDGVLAKYGKSLCIADNYQCSVEQGVGDVN
ncbi:hypothetical protein ACTXGL_02330 [Psychrobacter sp. T6-6]|uniref:hypothetical protein n=1 Tax=Psychrobacter sp. T6-6 TaxID=3457452 RepID=UPI003FD548D8